MSRKPRHASGYTASHVAHVRATCLYVATKLGDLIDETVIVGGLVPSLLVDQTKLRQVRIGTWGRLSSTWGSRSQSSTTSATRHSPLDRGMRDGVFAAEAMTVLETDFS